MVSVTVSPTCVKVVVTILFIFMTRVHDVAFLTPTQEHTCWNCYPVMFVGKVIWHWVELSVEHSQFSSPAINRLCHLMVLYERSK